MEELGQLGAFVRLADYLLVEGVMACAVQAVEDLLALLTAHKQQVLLGHHVCVLPGEVACPE